MQKEPLGRLNPEKLQFLKWKLLTILQEGGQIREVNEWVFFYDNKNLYQGYCLKKDWEAVLTE
jgi:hypothetical protein